MSTLTAFLDGRIIAQGERADMTRALAERPDRDSVRVFEDESGRVTDLDYRAGASREPDPDAPRGRGRPKLGVVAREVTLLPRQWEWLGRQQGGASAAIRRLVDEAAKAPPSPAMRRDAAYRFMSDMCGDRPGYEEALRALYRDEKERFEILVADWPEDVRAYLARLLG